MGSRRFLNLVAGLSPTSAFWSRVATKTARVEPLAGPDAAAYFNGIATAPRRDTASTN